MNKIVIGDFSSDVKKMKRYKMFKVLLVVLTIALVGMTYVAWHNSEPLNCVNQSFDGGKNYCTVVVK